MNEKQILQLIDTYLAGKASVEDTRQLDAWLHSLHADPALLSALSSGELQQIAATMLSTITRVLDAHPDVIPPYSN